MKRYLLAILFYYAVNSSAQIIISTDTTICGNYQDTLLALSATQSSMSVDDEHDVLVDIGFSFNFYGIAYTKLVVSGNGYITFDSTQAGQYSPYSINAAIPNPGGGGIFGDNMPENAIMAPWQDLNSGTGGSIYYGVTGVAPNRQFIVTWCAVPMYSLACSNLLHTSQVVLFEGSHKIEMFIQDKPICITWNSGHAVQGLVDANSLNADIVIDPMTGLARNWSDPPNPWDATNEGWEFIPNSPATSYTINPITYVPIIAGENTWTDALGNILGIGPTLPVNTSSTTTYFASITGNCSFGTNSDSVKVTVPTCFGVNLNPSEASCLGNDAFLECSPDTNLLVWDTELLDINGNSLFLVSNITDSSYTFSNLLPGTYIVNITSGISNSQDTVVVSQIPNPVTINTNVSDVSCFNGSDGQIGIWPTGGLAPYIFLIDGDTILNSFPLDSLVQNLSGGTYIVSAIDDNNCMMRDTVEITTPSYPLQALAASKVIICQGDSDGEVTAAATGGTAGYSYEWFDSGLNSFSTNDSVFGLSAGSYYLEVMDANGCDTFTTVNVIEPLVPLSASPQVFNVACKSDATGMIVGDASGSWAPYIYEWFDQNNVTLQSSPTYSFTRDTLKDLSSGIYFLKLTDGQGCSMNYTFNIEEPDDALSIDSVKVVSSIDCYGDSDGIARIYVSGGDPVYSYLWDNGEIGITATALTAGYHSVSLTDDWGCVVDSGITIPENPLIESELVVDVTVSCYGEGDGVASIFSIGGASSTYDYFWSQGQTTFNQNSDFADSLLQGSYYVTTRDDLGCEVIDTVYISHPEPLTMEALELDWIDCFGYDNGEASASAQGGTAPYSFDWNNDGVADGDMLYNLTPGVHTVVATDARGCTASDTVLIHEPSQLYVNIDTNQTIHPYCLGVNTASLTAIANGGNFGYSYEWDDNPVQPQITATATALLAGSYTVTVTDSKGCTASDGITITNTNDMEASVSSLITYLGGTDVSCYGADDGQALVSAWGAHPPYTYQWYGPNGYISTDDTISNLVVGVYSVTVKDTNNCMVNSSIAITEPLDILFTSLASTDESCLGACDGEVSVNVTGGSSPYIARLTEVNTGGVFDINMSSNNVVTGLCSGEYSLTFTDQNGCSSTLINGGVDQQVISTNAITIAQINTSNITPILCNGSATGELTVLNPNLSTGYSYSWQDLDGNEISNTITASNLLAGTYVLYADYNNITSCTSTDTAVVTENPIIDPSVVVTSVDCYGNSTGVLQSSVQGGVAPYNILWNPGSISATTLSGLQAGTYTLTVIDYNNCSHIETFEVIQPPMLLSSITQNGEVLTANSPTGGVAPYIYSWREQSSPNTSIGSGVNYLVTEPGIYYVLVIDANGCLSQSNKLTYSPLSVSDLGFDLNVYPNPFRKETTIDFGQIITKATIKIVDIYGKLIEVHEISDIDSYVIKRADKARGVYFMEIEINAQYLNKIKLVIQ